MPQFRLDHVAVAVRSIKPAVKLFRDALGGEYLMGGEDQGTWRWFQMRWPGGGKVELLEPLSDRSFLTKFLDSHGEGLHHMTFKTDDIRAAVARIQELGYELVDINLDNPGWKEAFFRPSKAHGTLIQVAESPMEDDQVKEFSKPSNLDELLS
jgi:methylmalonyl-CoA/ethylmalonyl-CoA epimerase